MWKSPSLYLKRDDGVMKVVMVRAGDEDAGMMMGTLMMESAPIAQ